MNTRNSLYHRTVPQLHLYHYSKFQAAYVHLFEHHEIQTKYATYFSSSPCGPFFIKPLHYLPNTINTQLHHSPPHTSIPDHIPYLSFPLALSSIPHLHSSSSTIILPIVPPYMQIKSTHLLCFHQALYTLPLYQQTIDRIHHTHHSTNATVSTFCIRLF